MHTEIKLSEKEIIVLEDTEFLLAKAKVTEKIYTLFEITRAELKRCVEITDFPFPVKTNLKTGKISRGENYLDLPYMVLDYPALFSTENIFAYRTMFWWGNFFSATLHLEGSHLNNNRKVISNNIGKLFYEKVYISVGKSPWQYHYGKENYLPLSENHKEHIANCNFLKLSKKIDIREWKKVPGFTTEFLKLMLSVLNSSA